MYFIKKGIEYFFPKIDIDKLNNILLILTKEEKQIFLEMSNYDKYHCTKVYEKLLDTELKNNKLYLRLALLHDCGKGKTGIITRVFHKIGFSTKLQKHSEYGYEKLKDIDIELAELIKNHHKKDVNKEMKIFQKCDDKS